MREQLARTPNARLNLVEQEKQPLLVAQYAQCSQKLWSRGPNATLTLHRLNQESRRVGTDRFAHGVEIAERHLIEPVDLWSKPVEMLLLTAGGDRRKRPPMERALERDDAKPLRPPVMRMEFPRDLDRTLIRLGARIAEENRVRKCRRDEALGQPLLPRHLVQVGGMPDLSRLGRKCGDQMRVRMTQACDRNARTEIQEPSPVAAIGIDARAPLQSDGSTRIGRQKRRNHGVFLKSSSGNTKVFREGALMGGVS